MSGNLSRDHRVSGIAVRGRNGIVAAQNQAAADVGAEVLAAGGNAVDAAVATGFALAALEPWMSGLGGGGYLVMMRPGERNAQVVDGGLIAAAALDPADYPLHASGRGGDLFDWPPVLDDRNLKGYSAIAVPGEVAALALAHERFGTMPWRELLEPAIALARRGVDVDWFTSLLITTVAPVLAEFPASREAFLAQGFPVAPAPDGGPSYRRIAPLAATLERLAAAGGEDFYRGDIAALLLADLAEGGSKIRAADLARYRAQVRPALAFAYKDAIIHAVPGLTGGPTLQAALATLDGRLKGARPDAAAYAAYATALRSAYAERFATMGDSQGRSCTTHLSVVDKDGTLVALTLTLLSLFGSKVVLPKSGVLMNNGVMWFDTRPGRPNSMAPGKRPLANMCPVLASRDGQPFLALGASGGRRITPALLQILSFLLDFRLDLEEAFHQPRIDVSGEGPASFDESLPPEVAAALSALGPAIALPRVPYPVNFAWPTAVLRQSDGIGLGIGEPSVPHASASVARA